MKVETNPNKTNIEITSGQSNVRFDVREQTTEVMGLKSNVKGPSAEWEWNMKEDKSNKVQTIDENSTSVQYPSAKAVYDTIQSIPGLEQIQSDWDQTDNTQVDFIKNKPTIPVVPTNVSAFTNDAGYITISDVPAQVQSDWNQSDNTQVDYIKNKPTIPVVPTNVSAFTNDADYLQTDRGYEYFWHRADWNESDTTKLSYILNKPTIPASQVQSNWNESDSSSLAYIQNKPSIPAAQVNSDWNSSSGVSQILNKPTIPSVATAITSGDTGYTTGDMVYQYILSLDGSQISY